MQRVLFVPIENNHVFNSTIPVDVSNFPDLPIIWEDEHGFSAYYLRNICQALQSGKWGKPIIQTDYALYSGFPRYKNFINNNGIFHQGFIFSEIARYYVVNNSFTILFPIN